MYTLNTKDLSISKREEARQLWQNGLIITSVIGAILYNMITI